MNMSPIISTRRKNLVSLINSRFAGSQSNFSSVTGISLSQIGQWLAAEDSPHLRNMSERSARKIEERASLPSGWLDQAHATSDDDSSDVSYVGKVPIRTLIPVVGIAQLGENGWYEEVETIGSEGYIEHFSHDSDAYVLRVKGDSMFPAIRNNWYVVVEPNSPVVIGEYVAIKQKDGRKMVKELLNKNSEEISLTSVNGGNRLTLPLEQVALMHAVAAVVSPSKHKDL